MLHIRLPVCLLIPNFGLRLFAPINYETANSRTMAEVIRMPLMSDTMTEGVIAEWLKKPGDRVEIGDILAEVETDKATMELESYNEGVLLYVGAKRGDAVPVNGILAIIGEKGEAYEQLLKEEGDGDTKKDEKKEGKKPETETAKEAEPETKAEKPTSKVDGSEKPDPKDEPESLAPSVNGDRRVKASPLAKRLAEEKGIDIRAVKGSGEEGRIVKRDVEQFEPSKPAEKAAPGIKLPEVVGEEGYEEVRVSQMRKTIARRLGESKFSAPHFYLTMAINMDRAVEARGRINEVSPVKVSFNDLVIKAVASALRKHPKVNASWLDDVIRYHKHIHIGMAVAVDEGLVVPVIRFADTKGLTHIGAEAKEFGQKARDKKLQPEEMQGNTFSISNLGMFGIEEFTAIINPPDACILAVGGIRQVPAVVDGEIKPQHQMKVTLSCDHRVVDGATGAQFLQTLQQLLEDPIQMLV